MVFPFPKRESHAHVGHCVLIALDLVVLEIPTAIFPDPLDFQKLPMVLMDWSIGVHYLFCPVESRLMIEISSSFGGVRCDQRAVCLSMKEISLGTSLEKASGHEI